MLIGCKKDRLSLSNVTRIESHTTHRLNRIAFLNDSIVIIGGGIHYDYATTLRSGDGGYTFTVLDHPESGKGIYGMGQAPNGTLYACGTDGTVLQTSGNGTQWQFNRIGDWQNYIAVAYPAVNKGVYVSSRFQYDGSITVVDSALRIVYKNNYRFGLNNVYFISPANGFVVAYGAVLRTADTGQTWNYLPIKDDNFMCMSLIGQQMWVCGFNGGVYYSNDNGNNWETRRSPGYITKKHYMMLSIAMTDSRHGYITCDNGTLLYTDDGGYHWAEFEPFTATALRAIAFAPPETSYLPVMTAPYSGLRLSILA
ncbi:MAG: hypothetical protein EBX41_03990 [Chitinophagia bacterium]|nr:hypothetical protein [Chitinophagia bacterium]